MKLWQKIFLLTLALVIIVVNAASLALLSNSHRLAIEHERQGAAERHSYLIAELQNTILYKEIAVNTDALPDDQVLEEVINVLEEQRDDATVTVSLFKEARLVYPDNIQSLNHENELLGKPDYTSSIVEDGDMTYLLIVSTTDLNKQVYQLVSRFDISSTYSLFREDFDQVRIIGIISALLVAGLLLLLVRGLLAPLRSLGGTTRRIASGNLDKRTAVKGHDELAEVARDFNTMADSIEHNVTKLEELAESRRVFIGNLAHEMKTPLTSILGFADILRVKREVSDTDRIEYANVIVSETRRLQSLSSKLMELLTLGNLRITPETVEVHTLIDEITTILQPIIQSHSLRLETALPKQQTYIQVDRELMKSLVLNLIDNSIKASSPESAIMLAVIDIPEAEPGQNTLDGVRFAEPIPADCVRLAVIDEGMGIPENEIPQLTEPFYMLDKARTRKHGGAGLGLALCSEIAQAHNSQLVINSQPGAGTTVSILLKKVGSNE